MTERVGETAYVCLLCSRVHDRRDYRVIPEIVYGSSPSMGRTLERREVHHLPIAQDEPRCGAHPRAGMGIPMAVTCRKFAWHNRLADRSMRAHDGGYPAPWGGVSFGWEGPEFKLAGTATGRIPRGPNLQ